MNGNEMRRDAGGWLVRWNSALAAAAVAHGDWPSRTIADYARACAAAHPDRVKLVDGDRSLTCAELVGFAQRLAGYFTSIGLGPGDVISMQLPNWWEASVIDLAASMTGLVVNPIVPINRDAEVTFMLNESRTKVMFVPVCVPQPRLCGDDSSHHAEPCVLTPRIVLVRAGALGHEDFDSILRSAPALARGGWCGSECGEAAHVYLGDHGTAKGGPALSQHVPCRLRQDENRDESRNRRHDLLSIAGHPYQRLSMGVEHAVDRRHACRHARYLECGARFRSHVPTSVRLHGGSHAVPSRSGDGGEQERTRSDRSEILHVRGRICAAHPHLSSRGSLSQLHSVAHLRLDRGTLHHRTAGLPRRLDPRGGNRWQIASRGGQNSRYSVWRTAGPRRGG